MAYTDWIKSRYENALKQNAMPHRMELPDSYFVSNVLPGRTSNTDKRLKKLQKMYTANEFSHFTGNFADRRLKLRTDLPVGGGRGMKKRKKKKKNTVKRLIIKKKKKKTKKRKKTKKKNYK